MTTTISGWTLIPTANDPRLRRIRVPGTDWELLVERVAAPLLAAFAADFNERVARIAGPVLDDWSWSPPRLGNASSLPSDHCSGRAIDINATGTGSQALDVKGIGDSWWRENPDAARAMRELLAEYEALSWGALVDLGGVYRRFSDPMHVFVTPGVSDARIRAVIDRLGIDENGIRGGFDVDEATLRKIIRDEVEAGWQREVTDPVTGEKKKRGALLVRARADAYAAATNTQPSPAGEGE